MKSKTKKKNVRVDNKNSSIEKIIARRRLLANVKIWSLSALVLIITLITGVLTPTQISIFDQTFSLKAMYLPIDHIIALGVIFALVPPSIYYQLESRRKEAIDNNLPILLQNVTDAGTLGMTLTRAIEVSAERDYGPLTKEVKKLVTQISWGAPLYETLKSFAAKCGTLLASRVAFFIQAAYKGGGEVQVALETINQHIQEIQNQEKRRKAEMMPYIGIIYMSFFVFLVTVYFLTTQFFGVSTGGLGLTGFGSGVGGFRDPTSSKELLTPIFFYMAMIQGVFSGLAGGKISTGSIQNGFTHATILCLLSFIVFSFL